MYMSSLGRDLWTVPVPDMDRNAYMYAHAKRKRHVIIVYPKKILAAIIIRMRILSPTPISNMSASIAEG